MKCRWLRLLVTFCNFVILQKYILCGFNSDKIMLLLLTQLTINVFANDFTSLVLLITAHFFLISV